MLLALVLVAGFAQDPAEWHARATAHIAQGEFPEARSCLTKAIELDPKSPALRVNLGNVLAKLGRTADAIEQFRNALEADPRLVSALFNLGVLYLEASEPQRALPLLQRAVSLRPQDDEIRSKYILSLVRAGLPERIQKELEATGPQTCSLSVGKELAARHLYTAALDQFRRERACQPEDLGPILGEATSLLALGRAREAIDAINARWDEARTQKHARWILGSAYERIGLYTEAFEHFASAVDLDPVLSK